MENSGLKLNSRKSSGKGAARRLRSEGRLPAVLYGLKEEAIRLSLSEREFQGVLIAQGETAIVDLTLEDEGNKELKAIIKEIQRHPATGKILHLDFQQIRRGEKIRLEIPVVLTGDPVGVKEMGGVLEHGPRMLQVRCLPRNIIENIDINVEDLKIQDAVHVKDIEALYPDLEFLGESETTLAIVVPPRVELEPTPVEEEAEETEEPEVIAKGKEEEAGKGESKESKESKEGKEGKEAKGSSGS
jgi:large subunit ribosomal protein L25